MRVSLYSAATLRFYSVLLWGYAALCAAGATAALTLGQLRLGEIWPLWVMVVLALGVGLALRGWARARDQRYRAVLATLAPPTASAPPAATTPRRVTVVLRMRPNIVIIKWLLIAGILGLAVGNGVGALVLTTGARAVATQSFLFQLLVQIPLLNVLLRVGAYRVSATPFGLAVSSLGQSVEYPWERVGRAAVVADSHTKRLVIIAANHVVVIPWLEETERRRSWYHPGTQFADYQRHMRDLTRVIERQTGQALAGAPAE